jgi:hypothetical protein|tara:strand:+ start:25 stop:198 length:174 start_codon:yes stop_codon:yes gene_type:complete
MKGKGKSTHKMADGTVMKGSSHYAKGGSVNMDSELVPQHKRMAAGYAVNQGSSKAPK